MKKIVVSFAILFYSLISSSQEKKLKNGTYSAYNSDKILNVLIQDQKLFLYIYPYEYSIKNDSVVVIKNQKPLGFSLNYSLDKTFDANKIKINVVNYLFDVNNIFIATEAEKAKSDYKSLSSIRKNLSVNGDLGTPTDLTTFSIDRTKSITLVRENLTNTIAEIANFDIPDKINVINIDYLDEYSFVNLSGVIKDNNLTLYNDAKEPMVFKHNNDSQPVEIIKPNGTIIKENWTFPGKISRYAEENPEMATDTATIKIESEKAVVFKHFISKNFKEALNHNATTPDKFLVVSIDLKNKNRQSEFDEFIKESEIAISEDNYYDPSTVKNQFDFYLATENDMKLLSKYKIKSASEILVLNSLGDLIYRTPEDLTRKKRLFGTYDNAFSELKKANMELAFDKVILNKKATNKQVLQMLSIAPLLEIKAKPIVDIEPVAIDVKTDPEYTTTTKPTTQEELKFADKTITPDTAKDEVKTDQIIEVETVKDDYDYYSVIKSKENLYRLKSTLQDANEKWEKIVKEFEKSNIIDTDYITVVKQQLNDAGFTKKIFDKSSFKIEDYRMLNYVFAKYNTLLKETDTKANPITVDSTRQATEKSNINVARAAATLAVGDAVKSLTDDYIQPIDNVLENYFGRFADEIDFSNKEIDNQKSIKFLLFEYYKKYVKLTDYKTNVVNSYINVLDDNLADTEIRTEYFEIFEIYFNKIMAPNKSIIENLDLDFSLYDNDYWVSYKNNFANSCNQIAWEIVKKSTDKVLIKKAIKWSETSVEIEKNTHYYWDTLARLYYLNGQKDKAILTQQKAIDLGKDSENGVEYNDVLEQMKNGTYTLPKKD